MVDLAFELAMKVLDCIISRESNVIRPKIKTRWYVNEKH